MNGVGILAIEVYFPSCYVDQIDLERENGVSAGKYTIGLGQNSMAFTGDYEDVNSISLTAVQALLEKYDISPTEIGRLEVGTESLVDKSKSTKTVLMSLFADSGNSDIEGATVINACYGGTAALLNALTWVDSSSWDGRYAVVVAADIAVYSDGPARPTGGCGSVAMLVGRNAPLQIDLGTRTAHATHVWDFFKPNMDSEYPEVNGSLSQTCFLSALDDCYSRFQAKNRRINGWPATVSSTDYFLFHSPYNKLVQKSFARLIYQDIIAEFKSSGNVTNDSKALEKWLNVPASSTYEDKGLESALKTIATPLYTRHVAVSCELSKSIGNTYTAAVYMNLANLVSECGRDLAGKKVVLFSYGSGALASMFAVNPVQVTGGDARFSLQKMQDVLRIKERLQNRRKKTPQNLTTALHAREKAHGTIPFKPSLSLEDLAIGAYYLDGISANFERIYKRKDTPYIGAVKIKPSKSLSFSIDEFDYGGISMDDTPSQEDDRPAGLPIDGLNTLSITSKKTHMIHSSSTSGINRNKTYVWASGRPNVNVVVTGVAAALPGRDRSVFREGVNNIRRIIDGEMLIMAIPDAVKDRMIEKNVIELKKGKTGETVKVKVDSHRQQIGVCASIGKLDLTNYGLVESIVNTMDTAVQVAIAAGLEALKDSKIVSGEGEGTSGWVLPESMQNSTGIVYATSFPALDTAIAEVSRFYNTKTIAGVKLPNLIAGLRSRLQSALPEGKLSSDSEDALRQLEALCAETAEVERLKLLGEGVADSGEYEFDRKFLFRVLVLGNAQLAQIVKAKGPNMQTNAACAGATQAVAVAYDMIQVGRAERVIVIAGDSASSDTLMPWLGNGFRALGAATTCATVEEASVPFRRSRSGMILGSGGIGIILESEEGAKRRFQQAIAAGRLDLSTNPSPFKCRLLGTLVSNSAFHGASMDKIHIAQEMERFISSVEKEQGISRAEIARLGVYFSHETSTHASPTSSCAANEIYGLRMVFGSDLKHLLILNTKGFTGHPMGVSFEDVVAAEVLTSGMVPPIANMPDTSAYDSNLGEDLKFSKGGAYPCKYALRFAAGFGSQIALALYGSADV